MRIDIHTSYVLANGKTGHVRAFHAGSEDQNVPAHYSGLVKGKLTFWRPDGLNLDAPGWTIMRAKKKTVKQVGPESSFCEGNRL